MPKRNIFFVLLIIVALLSLGAKLYHYLTDGFSSSNIIYVEMPDNSQTPLESEQIKLLTQIFKQSFTYMNRGTQCFAFVSDDKQYVLKFFKYSGLNPPPFIYLIPEIYPFKSYKENWLRQINAKRRELFEGYNLANAENKDGSALIYVHLAATQNLPVHVNLIDKIGLKKQIPLNEVVFILQRKGETLRARLQKLLEANQIEQAKQTIAAVLAMYVSNYQKGLYDRDHGVMYNIGFVDDKAFHLDVGRFSKDLQMQNPQKYKTDLAHVLWKIDRWTQLYYPQHHQSISSFIAQNYFNLINEPFPKEHLNTEHHANK